jgi:excisionase family DNA binding protein
VGARVREGGEVSERTKGNQPMSANDNSAVLTVSELAERWRCTRRSVLQKIHAGELHAFRIGERAFRVAMVEVLRHERGRAA